MRMHVGLDAGRRLPLRCKRAGHLTAWQIKPAAAVFMVSRLAITRSRLLLGMYSLCSLLFDRAYYIAIEDVHIERSSTVNGL